MFDFRMAIAAFCKSGIDYILNVPATGMSPIYDFYAKKDACLFASREEEAVALACGIAMAGKLPLVFIQQSGVGNMLNAYFGLSEAYDIYFPTLVLDRGTEDENPIQAYSSGRTIPLICSLEEPCLVNFAEELAIQVFEEAIRQKKRWLISKY